MTSTNYPVLEEKALGRANRRWLAKARNLSELPTQEPGTVLVFEVGSGHLAFTERRHLAGREDLVVNAISVSLVDVRPRGVTVQLNIPSCNPADDFIVLVDFRCRVEDAEAVVAAGLSDVTTVLKHYLRQDAALSQLTASQSIEQINEVRPEVTARIEAYYRLRAPRVSGMSIQLLNVRVVTPKDLAAHEKKMRDERWRQRHEALEHEGVDRSAARIRGYLDDGLSAINSIGVATGEVSLNQIAEQKYTELQSKRQDLVKLWESLPDAYRDTVAVDAQRIVDSVFDQILSDGKESLDSGQRAQRSLGAAPNSPGTGRDTDDD